MPNFDQKISDAQPLFQALGKALTTKQHRLALQWDPVYPNPKDLEYSVYRTALER